LSIEIDTIEAWASRWYGGREQATSAISRGESAKQALATIIESLAWRAGQFAVTNKDEAAYAMRCRLRRSAARIGLGHLLTPSRKRRQIIGG
jgi:hypothetical protein